AADLVPGDIVLFEGGDVVPADLRIVTASRLLADESALTGESLAVDKSADPVDEDVPLAERSSILFQGTPLVRGSGSGVVVATGMETELGRISELVAQAERGATPMEKRLEALGRKLVWVTVVVAVLVVVSGLFTGRRLFLLIETAIALAVATVPEGLPIISTIALARGLWRMARRNALIEQLSAVETLGSTSVILTDKTGTLTENRMTATRPAKCSARSCSATTPCCILTETSSAIPPKARYSPPLPKPVSAARTSFASCPRCARKPSTPT